MNLQLTEDEFAQLYDLVEGRIRELHPTIRRSLVHTCTDALKRDLAMMEGLRDKMRQVKERATQSSLV
jgi:hypothetical protein